MSSPSPAFGTVRVMRDPGAIIAFWERDDAKPPTHDPLREVEGWTELIQLTATELIRREDAILPGLAAANGFSQREARRALRGALGELTRHALLAIWEDEGLPLFGRGGTRDGSHPVWPRRTAVFSAGAIPQPGLLALVGAMMLSGRVLYRPSRQDGLLAPLFVETLGRVQREAGPNAAGSASWLGVVGERLLCASWPHEEEGLTRRIVGGADALVVFGGEAAVEALSRMRRHDAELFAYGPRMSFAVLDLTGPVTAEILGRAMEDFAEDVVAFDQRGCLSPSALFVLGGEAGAEVAVADALARALDGLAAAGGFAPSLPPAVAAEIHSLRAVYAMDPAGERSVVASAGLPGWTLLVEAKAERLRPTPGYQTLRIGRLAGGWEALPPVLAPWAGRLQAMGIGPDTACLPDTFGEELDRLGLSRVCPLGRMQSPPIAWTHDGNPFFPVRVTSG